MRRHCAVLLLLAACRSTATESRAPESEHATPLVSFEAIRSDAVPITIRQRTLETVPGSKPALVLQIDDITGGEVLLRLTGPIELVSLRSMRVGDTAAFELDGEPRVLGLGEMVNRLIGDDHAVFFVGSRQAVVKAQARAMLRTVHESEFRFVHEGKECSGPELAHRLFERYRADPDRFQTGKQFLDEVVAKPSLDGTTCQILGRAGRRTSVAKWLRLGWLHSMIQDEEATGQRTAR